MEVWVVCVDVRRAQELQDVAVFTQWVCRVRPRTYTDERALSSLRVGLLGFLSEQTSAKAAQAAAVFHAREQRLRADLADWAEAHEATMRAEIAAVESEAEKRQALARRSMGMMGRLNAAVQVGCAARGESHTAHVVRLRMMISRRRFWT
jgi:hypothetical protein